MSLPFALVPNTRRTAPARLAEILKDPGFVTVFSDHMAIATWTAETGWGDSRVTNYGPLDMTPGCAALHYGQEIFEGLKVYRHADGSIWFFRPEMNARRMIASAERMDLPPLGEADFLASVHALARADEAWVPSGDEMSYYMRPVMFADEAFLGVHSASRVTYAVVGGAAAPYIADGLTPVDIWVTTTYSRAGDGGTGSAKCGGNYASSLKAQREGAAVGCPQVLFTDAATHEWVEELGGMNFFAVTTEGRLVTPPTSGTILAGITRDSILALAPGLGLTPEVRPLSLSELFAGIVEGDIREAFACGTAAVVTPIGRLVHSADGEVETIPLTAPLGEATRALRTALVDIQWGRAGDPYGWMQEVRPHV
ncbi:MAG: branched-chain amino acid aminotransferase [Propionibacteriaceae bacterium]|jgi:branched-chain amino acid aminotransferase|nr:branched-chain amino acid aminotransferase [Propionibacteriaceae bacterium]